MKNKDKQQVNTAAACPPPLNLKEELVGSEYVYETKEKPTTSAKYHPIVVSIEKVLVQRWLDAKELKHIG